MLLDNRAGAWLPLSEELRALAGSPTPFYLTGSYFFGCAGHESDLDFIAQDSPAVREELLGLGFSTVFAGDSEYDCQDAGTADVWQSRDGKVQVQLAVNARLRRGVRDILCTYLANEHKHADREERHYLWNTLNELLNFKAGVKWLTL